AAGRQSPAFLRGFGRRARGVLRGRRIDPLARGERPGRDPGRGGRVGGLPVVVTGTVTGTVTSTVTGTGRQGLRLPAGNGPNTAARRERRRECGRPLDTGDTLALDLGGDLAEQFGAHQDDRPCAAVGRFPPG